MNDFNGKTENEIIAEYEQMLYYVAHKIFENPAQINDDLIQEGRIGLWRAIQDYDESKNTNFTTFAYLRIRYAMLNHLRDVNKQSKIDTLSFNYNYGSNEELEFFDCVADTKQTQQLNDVVYIADFENFYNKCTESQKEFIDDSIQGLNNSQIARKKGCSPNNIRRIEKYARKKYERIMNDGKNNSRKRNNEPSGN